MPLAFRPVLAMALCAAAFLTAPKDANAAADMHKVLRVASNDITSLDPQQGTDLYSTRVTSAIFEALYEFEYLSTGSKVIPNTAESMPRARQAASSTTKRRSPACRRPIATRSCCASRIRITRCSSASRACR